MEDKKYIRLAGYVNDSIVDGPGIRFSIFTQGCAHKCFNCHNPETWDFNGGKNYEIDFLINEIIKNPLLKGITLTGGDPLYQIDECLSLVKKLKEIKPNLDVVIYTGFLFEELIKRFDNEPNLKELLSLSDILIDGPYIDSKRDLTLLFRGSSNQRCINLKQYFLNNIIENVSFD